MYVSWQTPLAIGDWGFKGVDRKSCILYVPKGTSDDYRSSDWGDYFDNIVENEVTGMDKVTSSANTTECSRYSVSGQRLNVPTKGLNIVRYSDGSVRKVAVQ